MKVILTGGAGFIGSCFLWKLNSMGVDDVYVVDTQPDPSSYKNLQKKKFNDYISRDKLLPLLEEGKLDDVKLIVHLGACADTTERDEAYLRRNNIEYSQSLAKWALPKKRWFHYASSAAVYGDGKKGYSDDTEKTKEYKALNLYGESKRLFDEWVIDQGLLNQVVGYRYFNVFGPNEYHKGHMRSMVSKAFDQIKENGTAKLFATSRDGYENGSEERDFVYVKDVCDVMASFIEHPDRHGIFNLGTGQERTFKDLVLAVFAAMGKPEKIDWVPMPDALRGQYQYFTQADLKNLRSAGCDQTFQPLEESVKDYVQNHLLKTDPIL